MTGVFLHAASPLHIWFNVMAWRVAGRTVESLMGWWTLAPLFLVSALCGSLTSLWWLPRGTSIGASGGICGVIGCILVLGIRFRHQLPKGFARGIWGSVAYTVGMGLAAPNVIDNGAHLGGLIGGIVFGGVCVPWNLKRLPTPSSALRRGIATVALALLGAFAGVAVIRLFQGR
jgi:rhomboid protease GluP